MPRETFHQELDDLTSDLLDLGREVEGSLENMVRAMENCDAIVDTEGCERDEDLETALVEMARTARNVFNEGLDVFENRDIERARNLQAKDDKVDLLYSEAMNLIANPSGDGGAPEWRMRVALMVHYLERISDHGVDVGGSAVFLVIGQRVEDAMPQYQNRKVGRDGPTEKGKGALYERQPDVPVRWRVRERRGRQGRPRRSEGVAPRARRWHLRRRRGHQERRRQGKDSRQDRETDPARWVGWHGGGRSYRPDLPSLDPGWWTIGGWGRCPDRPP